MSRGNSTRIAPRRVAFAIFVASLVLVVGCQKMRVQPSYAPLQDSKFFDDGMSARPEIPGTVARGHLDADDYYYKGKVNGKFVTAFPAPVTRAMLERGRQRFDIYCSPCHGYTGEGDGMIVQRGYKKPPSYNTADLRGRPVGFLFDVITNGFGVMPPYAAQVPVADRWAIVSYIRVLQRSEHATLADVPPNERKVLEKEPQKPGAKQSGGSHE